MIISEKDWKRMYDLELSGKDGSGTASIIKDKNKAVARFIAGLKLSNSNLNINENQIFWGKYADFGNKAIELGATLEEIQKLYNTQQVPSKYQINNQFIKDKKLHNRFVGDLSKKILDSGMNIEFYHDHGYRAGNAITFEGKYAMRSNGRKWTIGYMCNITKGSHTFNLAFDAITDEGNGPTSYVIANSSHTIFKEFGDNQRLTKTKFNNFVLETLKRM